MSIYERLATGFRSGLLSPKDKGKLDRLGMDVDGKLSVADVKVPTVDGNYKSLRSLNDIAGARSTLDLNFAGIRDGVHTHGGSLPSELNVTRASTATRVNALGLLETVAANALRLDHDPVTLEPKGALIEEQRTNLLLQSEDLSQSWTSSLTAITSNTDVSPDGQLTADTIDTADVSTTFHFQDVSVADDSLDRTYSIFLKKGTALTVRLRAVYLGGTVATAIDAEVDFSGPVATANFGKVHEYPNGWVRWEGTVKNNNTGHNIVRCQIYPNWNSGAGGSGNVIVWGAQLEQGSFATSYIPTTTAQVTRAEDSTNTPTVGWLNPKEGTFFTEVDLSELRVSKTIFGLSDFTYDERMFLKFVTDTNLRFEVFSGAIPASVSENLSPGAQVLKVACAVKDNDMAIVVNGGGVSQISSGKMANVSNFFVGHENVVGPVLQLNDHVKRLTYFPTRLSNEKLQELTK